MRIFAYVAGLHSARYGIRGRCAFAFVVLAILTCFAGLVALHTYGQVAIGLSEIKRQGIIVTRQALALERAQAHFAKEYALLLGSRDSQTFESRKAALEHQTSGMLRAVANFANVNHKTGESLASDKIEKQIVLVAENTKKIIERLQTTFASGVQRARAWKQSNDALAKLHEHLVPLYDDASFEVLMRFGKSTQQTSMKEYSKERERFPNEKTWTMLRLAELRPEIDEVHDSFSAAIMSENSALIAPNEDRYVVQSYRAEGIISEISKTINVAEIRKQFNLLRSVGAGPENIFEIRRRELAARADLEQLRLSTDLLLAETGANIEAVVGRAATATDKAVRVSAIQISRSEDVLVGVVLMSVLFSLLFCWYYVGEGLVARLRALNAATLRIARGDLNAEIPRSGNDELTEMSEALEVFKEQAIAARELEFAREQAYLTDLEGRETAFRFLFKSNPIPMVVVDRETNKFLAVNETTMRHYGYAEDEFLGMCLDDLRAKEVCRDPKIGDVVRSESNDLTMEVTHFTSDGRPMNICVHSNEITWKDTPAKVLAFIDVTERKRTEQKIKQLAHVDPLTGLANRTELSQHMSEIAKTSQGLSVTILCLDLDKFKNVNDTMGHAAGDKVLKCVAERLLASVRVGDVVARLGGDEFAIILAPGSQKESERLVAERIINRVSAPMSIDSSEVSVGVSIGIASTVICDAFNPEKTLNDADIALYEVKNENRGAYRVFDGDLGLQLRGRRQLDHDLRLTLEQGGLALHYQPMIDLKSGKTVGFEALSRWQHPTRGNVPPSEFVSIAEENGLIGEIGRWSLVQAMNDATSWPEPLEVAINISTTHFKSEEFVDFVASAISETGICPRRVVLEVTETAILEDACRTRKQIESLRRQGVRTSLDDFGTGYSSLSYLTDLSFDILKIDRSFIADVLQSSRSKIIFRNIVRLGSALGMTIVAEGIETEDQRAFVLAEGVDYMQGYLVSPPRPLDDIHQYFENCEARSALPLPKKNVA